MPNGLDAQLLTIGRQLQVTAVTDASARKSTLNLTMPGGAEALSVNDVVTGVVDHPVEVTIDWIAKNVRFADTDLGHRAAAGGMPVGHHVRLQNTPSTTTSLIGTLEGDVDTPPGTDLPGVLGRITATIPIPIQQSTTVSHPVAVAVEWRVMDGQRVDPDVRWVLNPPTGASGTGGSIPVAGVDDTLELTFPPLFVELLRDTPANPTVLRTVHARVRLTATGAGVSSDWIDLPPVTIPLPAIPVPSVLVLCQNAGFGGRVFVMVPGNSMANDETTLTTALGNLNTALAPLMGTPFAPSSVLLGDLTRIPPLISDPANTRFRMADRIDRLSDVVYTDFLGIRTFSAEDSMSSLIFVGPPNRQIQCFNAPVLETYEGQMNVTLGLELAADITSLASPAPASAPAGRVSVPIAPAGQRFPLHNVNSFAGELSSLQFAWG